jgi:hypothetical protein
MNKKLLIPFLFLLMLADSSTSFAQKRSGGGARPAFDAGDNTLAFGLGLGPAYSRFSNANYVPAFIAYFDHGLIGNAGPGTVGLGGILGFQAGNYSYPNGRKYTETNFWIGVRGTYHLTILKDMNNKFDPYAGLAVGIHAHNWDDDNYRTSNNSVNPYVGPFIGAKYNFVPSFGAWTELGYDIAFFKIGLNFNF